jgi:ribosomal protein L11 methyltransferase
VAFRIRGPAEREEELTVLLWELGTLGTECRDVGADPGWLAYFPGAEGLAERLTARLVELGAAASPIAIPDVDWVARFREGFRAFRVGGFLVAPPWDLPADAGNSLLMRIDPGRAFGTGTHESTRLALLALERLAGRLRLGDVVDVGTGSGILALAARLLGARRVVATDIDLEAAAAARALALLNRVPVEVAVDDAGRSLARGAFDLVLANLSAPLLCAHSDDLLALARPGGRLVLSGILAADGPEVFRAFARTGVSEEERHEDGEWLSLTLLRRPAPDRA